MSAYVPASSLALALALATPYSHSTPRRRAGPAVQHPRDAKKANVPARVAIDRAHGWTTPKPTPAQAWTPEELAYAARVSDLYRRGVLPNCPEGITLRVLLAKLLNCQPMRVSKKYSGEAWATHGKRPYTPARFRAAPDESALTELWALEQSFHRSLRPGARLTMSLLGASSLPTPAGARQWLVYDGAGAAGSTKRPRTEAPTPAPPAPAVPPAVTPAVAPAPAPPAVTPAVAPAVAPAAAAAQAMVDSLHAALAGPRPPTLEELRARAPGVYAVVARAAEESLAHPPPS